MTPKKFTLPTHRIGDRWPAGPDEDVVIKIGPLTFNDEPPTNTLDRVEMRFALGENSFVLDSEAGAAGTINITDAVLWVAEIPVIQNFLSEVGIWTWDMAFYDSVNASPLTIFAGKIPVISQA